MPSSVFMKTFHVRWGDMDFNAHMRNTAYLDVAADVRLMYFQEHGFSMREFEVLRIGPVIMRDEVDYFRELHLLESITVSLQLAGLSADASRFRLRNDFFQADGTLAARVTSTVAWLDLTRRKLSPPPDTLATVLRALEQTDDFQDLSSGA